MADVTQEGSTNPDHTPARQRQNSIDKDAQEMVIGSLRAQVQDLFSQVSELNNKLVKSYDRVSDLEDNLHMASANVRSSSVKISQLELERTQHLSALNTGLLVEKSHVTTELNRLMEKATEEAAQRGQAESARMAIEKDLDDLSATLFGQANSMVAEARYEKFLSERKVEDAERALKTAEEAVQLMQTQMQAMQSEKEEALKKTRDMELAMGKGKWVATRNGSPVASLRLLNTHSPFQEYLNFIAHLRVLHPSSILPPAMSTLLQLPFLHRLLTEDSEPTLRLDLAPSLNWLSRRSVLTAIHSGQLTIEPVSATALFAESSTYPTSTTVAGMNSTKDNITCALCGVAIFPAPSPGSPASQHPPHVSQNSWSGSFFKKSLSGSSNGTQPASPMQMDRRNSIGTYLNSQVFIFRMASLPTASISSLPIPSLAKSSSQSNGYPINTPYASTYGGSNATSHSTTPNNPSTIYPLCMSGWCLQRLRKTCNLWGFVRTGIVDKIWDEELPPPPPPPMIAMERSNSGEKPPIPPRKRGLWGIASALGERAASWSGDEKDKSKKSATTTPTPHTAAPVATASSHNLPPPPPVHPSLTHVPASPRRLPPPLPPLSKDSTHPSAAPPPLPRRNEGRTRTATGHLPSPPPEAETLPVDKETAIATEEPAPITEEPAPVKEEPSTTTTALPTASTEIPAEAAAPPPVPLPASLPLPESRPATPSGPARATSPAVALTGNVAASPPPIPRRAAARTRTAGGSRPTTPANADTALSASTSPKVENNSAEEKKEIEEKKESEDKKEDEDKKEAETEDKKEGAGDVTPADTPADTQTTPTLHDSSPDVVPDVESTHKAVESPANPGATEVAAPDLSSRASSTSDVFVDALTPAASVSEALDVPSEGQEKLQVQEDDDDKATIVDTPSSNQPETAGETEKPVVADQIDIPSKVVVSEHITEEPAAVVDGPAEERSPAANDKSRLVEQEDKQSQRQSYVGDATWEEKTWKELVRLREDMFWARVGRFAD